MMENKIIQMIEEKDYQKLRIYFSTQQSVDIAQLFDSMQAQQLLMLFRILPKDLAADVFSFLDGQTQEIIISSINDGEVQDIVNHLFLDDAVDFVEEMPANLVKKILKNATAERREQINRFLKYDDASAGSVMTIEFMDIKENMTVSEAIARIRKVGLTKVTVDTCYVIDYARKIKGTLSLKELILNKEETLVSSIMMTNVIKVSTYEDQEIVAQMFKTYDLLSMPVVDKENRLVGIITIDDIIDIIDQENTEDFHKMAAMEPNAEPYLKTKVFTLARKRITWLLVLMVTATITGRIIEGYEEILAQVAILASFIPMLMDTGGNAGSQSSAMIIRELALGDIKTTDYLKVIFKELSVALCVGIGLVVVNFARMLIMGNGFDVITTVSIALFFTVIIANVTGGILPLIAKKLRLDPAVMAGPLITTVVDSFALVIYFFVATQIMVL